jgi:hypothetical protein
VIRVLVVAGLASCSSSPSNSCDSTQVEVSYLRGARDGETVCKPIPASCGAVAACDVQACIRDMYGYCDSPYIGVGCSDTFPPTIISCNP